MRFQLPPRSTIVSVPLSLERKTVTAIVLLSILILISFKVSAQCADISYTGDCDGDGVINGLDLDDDNDGIYDIDEVDCATPAMNSGGYNYYQPLNSGNTASGTLTNLASYTGVTASSPTYFDYYYEVQGTAVWGTGIRMLNNAGLGGDYLNFQVNKSEFLTGDVGYVELNFNEYVTNLQFDLGGIDNQDAMSFVAYYNGVQVPPSSIEIQNVNIPPANFHLTGNKVRSSSGGANAPANTARIIATGPVDQLVLRFAKESYNGVSTWQIYNFQYCIELNHDTDGNPNRFDLDSDDDICPDVIEANYSDQNFDGILGDLPTLINNVNGTVIGTNALVGYAGTSPAVTDGVPASTIECGILLPVEMIKFEANCADDGYNILWSTASEINNDYFLIQSSEDGVAWETIRQVEGVGNSISITNYEANNLYISPRDEFLRIKQVDFDGEYSFSSIIVTPDCEKKEITVSTLGNSVEFTNPLDQEVIIHISTMSGQLLETVHLNEKERIELSTGVYFYSYTNDRNELKSGRILIVH